MSEQDQAGRGIGTDEWVAQHEDRVGAPQTGMARLAQQWTRLPALVRWGIPLVIFLSVPFIGSSDYILRIGINLGLFVLLALGLNLVVGYSGLLDLGFVAFYGFGAYAYAMLSSDQFGVHLNSLVALVLVIGTTASFGFILGLPSRRLTGDYLAIATLFFGQMFAVFVVSSDEFQVPGMSDPVDLTGGANGITQVDQISVFGFTFETNLSYYLLLVVLVVFFTVATKRIHFSRHGLAWRSLGEDTVAAQHMTIPTVRLKLLAFTIGAGVAGLAGAIFASVQQGVYPSEFMLPLLITIYAALILGGLGSIPGILLGAFIMVVLPEVLRFPDYSNGIFLAVLIIAVIATVKSWKVLLWAFGGMIVIGFLVNGILLALHVPYLAAKDWITGPLAPVLGSWVFMPENRVLYGNIAFVALVGLAAWMSIMSRRTRIIVLPFALWLAIWTWEVRLLLEPSVTRQLLIGALLIVLMASRPQGLLGKPRVEVL